MNDDFDVALVYPSMLSEDYGENKTSELREYGVRVSMRRQEPEPYAAAEWAVPEALMLFVTNALITGFIAKYGADAATTFNTFVKNVLQDAQNFNVRLVASSKSPMKLRGSYNQSHSFSFTLQTVTGVYVKLLFDQSLKPSIWEDCAMNFLALWYRHHQNFPNDKLTERINSLDLNGSTPMKIYAIIDRETLSWVLLSSNDMHRKDREGWSNS